MACANESIPRGATMPVSRRAVFALLMLLAMTWTTLPAIAAWSTVRQVEGAERVLVEVGGKKRAYWKLEKGRTMEVSVTGPAVLRVYSRSEYKLSYKKDPYTLSWSLPGGERETLRHEVTKSRGTQLAAGGKLSASRTDEIDVPPGTHRLQIQVDDCPGDEIYLRLKRKFVHPIPRGGNIDLVPLSALPVRDVVVRESRTRYHVLSSGDEAELDVIGPTFVKAISRLDWNETMSGRQKYMIKVYLDGEFRNTWVLQGRRSEVAVYSDKPDSTPAEGEVIYIDVPKGRHRLNVRFQDSGRELNMRFLLPRESLRNSE